MKDKEILKDIVKLLGKKDYSEKEILEKFPSLSSEILERIKKERLVDDNILAERLVNLLKEKGKGFYFIIQQLEKRKIREDIIEKFKREYDFEDELKRCEKIFEELKKQNKKSIILNLKSRGFPDEIIEKVMRSEFGEF